MKKITRFDKYEFDTRSDGLYGRLPDKAFEKIAPPIRCIGRAARADGSSVSQIVSFLDDRGDEQEIIALISDVELKENDFYKKLRNQGYPDAGNTEALAAVRAFVLKAHNTATKHILLVDACGWLDDQFVLGSTIISPNAKVGVRLVGPIDDVVGKFAQSGSTLEHWQRNVARRCARSDRLLFGLCTAFAAPCLRLVNIQGGGFNYVGDPGIGKTTCLNGAASVYGGGKAGYVESWDMTDRAPETIGLVHNDLVACLDELDELSPGSKDGAERLKFIIHRLSNGRPRQTSHKAVGPVIRQQTTSLFLSTSENSIPKIMRSGGKRASGGQLVRFVDIPADAGVGLGVLNSVPNRKKTGKPYDFSDYLSLINVAITENYGVAGLRFLQRLVEKCHEDKPAVRAFLQARIDRFVKRARAIAPESLDARIIRRFAAVCAGGCLAIEYGVLPKCNVWKAVFACFKAAISVHPEVGKAQVIDPVVVASNLVNFLRSPQCHSIALRRRGRVDSKEAYEAASALIRLDGGNDVRAMVKRNPFRDLFPGRHQLVAKALRKKKVLKCSSAGGFTRSERVPGLSPKSDEFYVLNYTRLKALAKDSD